MRGACHIDCTPLGDKLNRLYGLLNRGEAYLIPSWLMQEQRLAQVQSNQSNAMWQKGTPEVAQISALLPITGASSSSTSLSQC